MGRWVRVSVGDGIPAGAGRPLDVDGLRVALFNDGARLYAVDDRCPHRGASLGEGLLTAGTVTCPWHGWTFDVRTGRNPLDPDTVVACYPVRRVGEDVEVEIPDVESLPADGCTPFGGRAE